MCPGHESSLGHNALPGCGSLTGPLDRVQGVTALTLARTSQGTGGSAGGGPTRSGSLPTARSGNLGKTCHMLGCRRQAGKRKATACLAVPGASVTISPPGPASCYTAAFLFSSPRLLAVPTSSSNSSYSAQQSEPLHRLQAAGGFAGSRSAMCQPSTQRGAWPGVGTWG